MFVASDKDATNAGRNAKVQAMSDRETKTEGGAFVSRRRVLGTVLVPLLSAAPAPASSKPPGDVPRRTPDECGFAPAGLEEAGRLVSDAVVSGVPGAVLVIGRNGATSFQGVYGNAVQTPTEQRRAMTPDTLFDMASLTKVVAAMPALALLVQEGRVDLDTPVSRYLPSWQPTIPARQTVTPRHLLTHTAGLPAGGAYAGKNVTLAQVVFDIARSREIADPGVRTLYSDFSAVLLGAIVESVTDMDLAHFCHERIYAPLGMNYTGFRPALPLALRCAATTPPLVGANMPPSNGTVPFDGSQLPVPLSLGLVHDPLARALGGVSGNAGLFSTASDLARYAVLWLRNGQYGKTRLFKSETVRQFTETQTKLGDGNRALGWDKDSAYSIRGNLPVGSYGHTGFTGTSLWLDPQTQTFVILLTNAVHGDDAARQTVIRLRRVVSSRVAGAIISK